MVHQSRKKRNRGRFKNPKKFMPSRRYRHTTPEKCGQCRCNNRRRRSHHYKTTCLVLALAVTCCDICGVRGNLSQAASAQGKLTCWSSCHKLNGKKKSTKLQTKQYSSKNSKRIPLKTQLRRIMHHKKATQRRPTHNEIDYRH